MGRLHQARPWRLIKRNDRKRARLEAIRFVLSQFDYPEKDTRVVGRPDGLIVGRAESIHEVGETTHRLFPKL